MTKVICDRCGSDRDVHTYEVPARDGVEYCYDTINDLNTIIRSDKDEIDFTYVDLCRNCALNLVDYIQQFFTPVNKKD